MKNIYTFGRKPAQRNYTIPDLRALKGSDARLTMCNPANEAEIRACVDAGIDILTVWDDQLDIAREIAPTHFMGTAMNWGQHKATDEILRAAVECMEAGADMYFTNRSYEVIEMLANEHIPVQAHMGLVPSVSIWGGGLRAYGRTADEALELLETFRRLEDAGCFAVEIECVAEETLNLLNDKTSIVTFSLGCGNSGDVIFLFMSDICGESADPPRHAHACAEKAIPRAHATRALATPGNLRQRYARSSRSSTTRSSRRSLLHSSAPTVTRRRPAITLGRCTDERSAIS